MLNVFREEQPNSLSYWDFW